MADSLPVLFPFLASMALVCGLRWRSTRRRTALNRALHELRRPLQAMALAPRPDDPATGPLETALAALDDLDAAINGTPPALTRRPVAARPLVENTLRPWRGIAARRDRQITLDWRAGTPVLLADPARVAQAVDNLLANALEHGRSPIRVEVRRGIVGLSISVLTQGAAAVRAGADPRRGHGLAVVDRVAAAHLGRFRLHIAGDTVAAVLELPLAPRPLPVVPIEWAAGRRERPTAPGLEGRATARAA